jgi:hypothetical protein
MRSDAKDVGIGKAVPLAQWKSSVPLVRTAPGPGQPIHRAHQGKLARGSTWTAVPHNRKPRFHTLHEHIVLFNF